jgi:hypothetical protein
VTLRVLLQMNLSGVLQLLFVDVEDEDFVTILQVCAARQERSERESSRAVRYLQPLAMHRPIPRAPPLISTAFGSVTSVPVTPAILESGPSRTSQRRRRDDFVKIENSSDKNDVSRLI